jgi:single stranded DNA-binding protein
MTTQEFTRNRGNANLTVIASIVRLDEINEGRTTATVAATLGERKVYRRITAFGKRAAPKLAAMQIGDALYGVGPVSVSSYEDAQGVKRKSANVRILSITVLDAGKMRFVEDAKHNPILDNGAFAIEVTGNVVAAPELRYAPEGQPSVSFSVAVNEDVHGTKTASYFVVRAKGPKAEHYAQTFTKGALVKVIGSLVSRNYEGSDGIKRYEDYIEAERVVPITRSSASNALPADEEGAGDAAPWED